MPLPQPFTTASPVLVNYDFEDVEEGIYRITYRLLNATSSTQDNFFLSRQDLTSATNFANDLDYFTSVAKTADHAPFNIPKTAKGIAYASGHVQSDTSDSFSIKIQHVRGATVTDISSTITSSASGSVLSRDLLVAIPLTETVFADGDILRVIVTAIGGSLYYGTAFPFKLDMSWKLDQ